MTSAAAVYIDLVIVSLITRGQHATVTVPYTVHSELLKMERPLAISQISYIIFKMHRTIEFYCTVFIGAVAVKIKLQFCSDLIDSCTRDT